MVNKNLAQQLADILTQKKIKISVAESFTGGLICSRLILIKGASEFFYEGLVTYNEHAKMARLAVGKYTIEKFTAVSEQTAYQMADGLLKTGNCEIAIATTGYAGGVDDNKNDGLCYIAVGTKSGINVFSEKLDGGREQIMKKGAEFALETAVTVLKSKK